ncbi:histidine phosphatase family protein [Endozoicomonas ascidiicola]|uniref:histidine phosphatase family protein n=1 Tax=Endozoicomonas ascidiicola TaxID=1698521 RepID=UPI00082CD6D2|nr:alpha-ribazole phosphatase family protein [Endozoicomonas ascidiicola]
MKLIRKAGGTVSEKAKVTVIDLLRHGEPLNDGSLNGRYDVELSRTGWQQLQSAVANAFDYQAVISSPLKRCRLFAEYYTNQHAQPLQVVEGWQEMNFGLWDGKPYTWIHQHYPETLSAFWKDPWKHAAEGGESLPDFHQRINDAWQTLLSEHEGDKILLVTHSGVIRQLLSIILGMDPSQNLAMSRLHIPYGSISRIEVYHDEQGGQWPRLMFLNGQCSQ